MTSSLCIRFAPITALVALGACNPAESDGAPAPAPATASVPVEASAAPPTVENASEADLVEQDRQARAARAAADPVVGVIERAELCIHFGGEEAYDEARRAQINKAFEDNRCDTVVADGDALKASRPQDAARIDQAIKDLREWL